MSDVNQELIQLMREIGLSREEISCVLNVPLITVYQWARTEGGKEQLVMPESELKLLKYSLMSENK
jgi:hypothetical protein